MNLVLSIALVILYVDNKRTRDCISGYMVADATATKVRTDVLDRERAAFRDVLEKIVDPKGTPQSRKEVIDSYIVLVQRDDEVRRANPVRPVPTRCD